MPRRMMCRLSVVLGAAAILAAGCSQAAAPSPTPGATPQPDPVSGEKGVPFESENSLNAPGKLDVYWPVEAGPWPVVVMFHGGGMNSGNVEPIRSPRRGPGLCRLRTQLGQVGRRRIRRPDRPRADRG